MAEEINKRDAEDIKNLRAQEADITRQLIDLRDKLVGLSREDKINLQDIADIQSRALDLEKQRQGVNKQIISLTGEELVSDKKRDELKQKELAAQQKIVEVTKNTAKISKENEIIQKQASDTAEGLKLKYERIDKYGDSTLKSSKEYQKARREALDIADSLQKVVSEEGAEQEGLLRATRELATTNALVLENIIDKAEAEKAARQGKFIELDTSREILGLSRIKIDIESAMNAGQFQVVEVLKEQQKILQNQYYAKEEMNGQNMKDAEMQAKILKTADKIRGTIEQTKIGGVFDGMEAAVSKIPGGASITKALGLNEVQDSLKKNLGDSLTNVVTGFQQGGAAGMQSLVAGAKSFGMALMAGPQVIIFAILAAVGLIIGSFMDVDKSVSEIQKTLGGTKDEALKTQSAARGMAKDMGIVGVNTQEVVKGMATVSDIMGGLDVASQIKSGNKELEQFAKDATVLSEKFGMSADEISNIKSLATLTGESMGSLVSKSQGLSKGLMTDKAAMKALADVPKSVAVAFKGGTESLIKASQKAKMLGMDLKRVQDIGDGMLDIESSLAKEMEARVLTGKNLNLDTARQLALSGDIAGLQDELLNQAGSLSEFQSMNRLQQKSMAEAMGMSVDEMTEMLTKAQEYRDIGLDSSKISELQNMNQEQLAEKLKNTTNAQQKAYIEKLAAEKESATMAENLQDIMTKIKEAATKLIAPIIGMVHSMFDAKEVGGGLVGIFDGIFSILSPIVEVLMGVGKIIFNVMVQPFKLIFGLLSPMIDAVKEIFSVFSSGAGSVGGIGDIFTKINDVISSVFGVVTQLGSAIIGMLITPMKILWTAIVTPLWTAFQGIFTTFTGLFDVVKKAFEPLFPAQESGEETAGIMDTIKGIFEKLQPVITAVGNIIATLLVTPITLFADLIGYVVKLFTGDFKGAIDGVGKMFYDLFIGLPKMIYETIFGAIDSIFGTNLKGSVTKFFDFATGVFGDIGTYIQNIGKLVLDYVMAPFDLVSTVIDGIVQMFSGDFMGGLETIGGGIKDFIMAPFDLVSGLFDNLMGTIGKITDKVSGALSIFGIGGEEETEKKAEETKGAGGAQPATAKAGGGAAAPAAAANLQKSAGGEGAGGGVSMNPKDYPDGSRAQKFAMDGDAEGLKQELQMMGAAATGGIIKKGGATLVGEKGPEVVSLPQGSVVANASATQQVGAAMDAMGGQGGEQSESPELLVLQSIDAKIGAVLEPLQKMSESIGGVIGSVAGGLGSAASGIMGSVGGALGSLFGGGESQESGEKGFSPMQQSTMGESPMGATQTGGAGGAGGAGGSTVNMSGVEGKLDKLIGVLTAAVSQPTIIKFGDRFIEEIKSTIDMKKSYQAENNYGRKV